VKREELVDRIGSQLHEQWRAPRWKADEKKYDPRWKDPKDENWAREKVEKYGLHPGDAAGNARVTLEGKVEIDIANTRYADLTAAWKAENKAAAEVVADLVLKAAKEGRGLDERFIEEASSVVHDKWLERNGAWADANLKNPYAQLPEGEKEKDRAQVRLAVKEYKELAK